MWVFLSVTFPPLARYGQNCGGNARQQRLKERRGKKRGLPHLRDFSGKSCPALRGGLFTSRRSLHTHGLFSAREARTKSPHGKGRCRANPPPQPRLAPGGSLPARLGLRGRGGGEPRPGLGDPNPAPGWLPSPPPPEGLCGPAADMADAGLSSPSARAVA